MASVDIDNLKSLLKNKKHLIKMMVFLVLLIIGITFTYAYYNDSASLSILANKVGDFDSGDGDVNLMIYKETKKDSNFFARSYSVPAIGYKFDEKLNKCSMPCSDDETKKCPVTCGTDSSSSCYYSYDASTNIISLTSSHKVDCKFYFKAEAQSDIEVYILKEDLAGEYTYAVNSKTYSVNEVIPAFGYKYIGYECENPVESLNYNSETRKFSVSTKTKNICYAYFDQLDADITANVYVQKEMDSTIYNKVESIPANEYYKLSTEKNSYCYDANGVDTGATITYEEGYINISSSSKQTCDIYLDITKPVDLSVLNVDTTKINNAKYKKSIDCGATGSATFDTKYQRFEFGNVVALAECNINYTEDTSNYPKLNQAIIDMAVEGTHDGTGQATGDVVHEVELVVTSDATYTKLTQDEYVSITNTSTYPFVWDDINSQWTQSATVAKSSSYFKFYPSKAGFYQVCYTLPSSAYSSNSSSYKNYIRLYYPNTTNSTLKTVYSNNNSGDTITGCVDYGYVTSSDYIYISGYYYDNNISFYAQMTNDGESLDTGYRYEGKSPKNYIWFNNELWRIIGSIPTCTSSGCTTSENLVKIIRAESIGGLAYDAKSSGYTGAWGSNTLYSLLNTHYYASNSENMNGQSHAGCYGYYGYSTTSKADCDYRGIGIDANSYYGKMVRNVYWNTGASNYLVTAGESYTNEIATQTVSGYIGLMSASDYGYAANSSYHSTSMNGYNTLAITGTDWLFGQGDELTNIQYSSDAPYVLYVHTSGRVGKHIAYSGSSVRPVLYLDSSVYLISGEGTQASPYMIGM